MLLVTVKLTVFNFSVQFWRSRIFVLAASSVSGEDPEASSPQPLRYTHCIKIQFEFKFIIFQTIGKLPIEPFIIDSALLTWMLPC